VRFLLGLAKTDRLVAKIESELERAAAKSERDRQSDAGEACSWRAPAMISCRAGRRSMQQRSRWRWSSIVCLSRPVALKFGDEDLQFFFRQVQQIALGQIGAAALEFGVFGEKLSHQCHHLRSRLCHAQLPTGRPDAITGRRPLSA
jgi:hypothetical protein